jgi:hypothetical protein
MLLGFTPDADDDVVYKDLQKRVKHETVKHVCKPCWELKYCPYGPLVEEFPLLPPTKADAIEHNEFLKEQLAKGAYDEERRKMFEDWVRNFKADDYPEQFPQAELDMCCTVFGHMCPVFFVSELSFTETEEMRRIGRHIPVKMKMRVARRDNYTCQVCGKSLRDDEIEFDHKIPISEGGSSEEHNIRVICFNCNRIKSNRVEI